MKNKIIYPILLILGSFIIVLLTYFFILRKSDSTESQTQTNAAANVEKNSHENKWNTFQDPRYTFQFQYPAAWDVENSEETPRLLILKDEGGVEIVRIDTGVNPELVGISYCDAYPQDNRCEFLKTQNGDLVVIDWGEERPHVILSSQNGNYGVSFTLQKMNTDIKSIFRRILSTFKFIQ